MLIEGDVLGSLKMFPATIPLVFTFIFLLFHLRYQFYFGAKTLVYSFSLSAVLILVNYAVKFNHFEHLHQ